MFCEGGEGKLFGKRFSFSPLTLPPYPSKNFWNIACKYDIKAVYGIDAHYRGQILLWTKLRQLADIVLGNEIIGRLHFLNEWP